MSATSPSANLAILAKCRIFEAAPAAELERLATSCVFQRYRRGAEIARRGVPGDSLIVVGRGRIKGTLPSANATGELIINIFWPGDVFGEIGVFEPQGRAGTAVAIAETEVTFVPRSELLPLIGREPTVAIRLMEALCHKLRTAVDQTLGLRFLDLPSRFYQRLLYLERFDSQRDSDGVRIRHGLSQQELADSIGASREALNKLISEWRRAGLLESGRGFVVVRDPAALAQRLPSAVRRESLLGEARLGESLPTTRSTAQA